MIVCGICKKNPRRKIMVKDVIYDKTKSPGTRFDLCEKCYKEVFAEILKKQQQQAAVK